MLDEVKEVFQEVKEENVRHLERLNDAASDWPEGTFGRGLLDLGIKLTEIRIEILDEIIGDDR